MADDIFDLSLSQAQPGHPLQNYNMLYLKEISKRSIVTNWRNDTYIATG